MDRHIIRLLRKQRLVIAFPALGGRHVPEVVTRAKRLPDAASTTAHRLVAARVVQRLLQRRGISLPKRVEAGGVVQSQG